MKTAKFFKAGLLGFLASFGITLLTSACVFRGQCGSDNPEGPPPEQSLLLKEAKRSAFNSSTGEVYLESPLNFVSGSINTEGDTLTITYNTEFDSHEIRYILQPD